MIDDDAGITDLALETNMALIDRIVAAILTSGMLTPDMTAKQAVERYHAIRDIQIAASEE